MLSKFLIGLVCLVALLAGVARAATVTVGQAGSGATYTTIQEGIDAAQNGDTVLVAPGTYYENIDFKGKAITVTSTSGPTGGAASTIIDGGAVVGTATVLFDSGETSSSVLSGFTIRNGGHAPPGGGPTGGMYIVNSGPTVSNNVVTANACTGIAISGGSALIEGNEVSDTVEGTSTGCSEYGSPIFVDGGNPSLLGNTIENNVTGAAGAIDVYFGSGVTVANNIIRSNQGTISGGIIVNNVNNISILQNVIYGNTVSGTGAVAGGISIFAPYSTVGPFTGILAGNTITGNIFLGPASPGYSATDVDLDGNLAQFLMVNNVVAGSSATAPPMTCDLSYASLAITPLVFDHNDIYDSAGAAYGGNCNLQAGSYGNVSVDPLFVNSAANNYELQSVSPVIDAGNNSAPDMASTDILGNPRIVDASSKKYPVVDMGAYEFAGQNDAVPTTLTLTPSEYFASANPMPVPPALSFSVNLSSSAGTPTGPVTIYEDATALGTVQVGNTGEATFNGGNIAPGLHAFTATYAGTQTAANTWQFPPAVSVKFFLLIPDSDTTLSLISTPNPSVFGQTVQFTVGAYSADGSVPSPITLTDTSTNTTLTTLMLNSSGAATFSTDSLVIGSHNVVASYAGDASHAAASASVTQDVAPGNATNTVLHSSVNPSLTGQSVMFTAQVTTSVAGGGTPQGSILFGYGANVLGTIALDGTGSASVSTTALPSGSDTITATYEPSGALVGSSNTLAQVVLAAQTISYRQPAPAYAGTSVLLSATASSGLPVIYSVVSGPATVSGSVLTYTGVGTVVVEAEQAGDGTYAAAPAVQQTVTTQILTEPVGTASGTVATVVTFTSAGTFGSITGLTQGAPGMDFAVQLPNPRVDGNACVIGMTYAAGENCTVDFSFTPTHPGQRYGGITLTTSAGALLANSYISGMGTGPQVVWSPGSQALLGSGFNGPAGVAVDGNGNIFVADDTNNLVKEIPAAGGYNTVVTLAEANGNFDAPDALAVDGNGNVFVVDRYHNEIKEIVAAGGYTTVNTLAVANGNFNTPSDLAIDGSGNIFVADQYNHVVKEILLVGGYTQVVTIGSGETDPDGIAVDGSGNVFISTQLDNTVKEIVAAGGYTAIHTISSNLNGPIGLAVDGEDNVFVADFGDNVGQGTGGVKEILAAGGYTTVNTLGNGFGFVLPIAIAADSSGNVYVADVGLNQILKLDYADPPSLNFAATAVGSVSSDSPQTVTMSNDGNEPLVFATPASGTNPSITTGFTIGSGSMCPQVTTAPSPAPMMAVGGSCSDQVNFAPVAGGVDNGKLVTADNALNVAGATQTVLLNGNGLASATASATAVLVAAPTTAYSGQNVMLTATVTPVTGTTPIPTGTVIFYDGTTSIGSMSLAAGSAVLNTTMLPVGADSLTCVYSGDGTYATANCAAVTVTVTILPQDFTITANPPSITIQTEYHKSMTLTLMSIGGFSARISLECLGPVQEWVSCSFPGAPVFLPGTAGASVPATLTINTDALENYKSETQDPTGMGRRMAWAGVFPLLLLGVVRKRRRLRMLAAIVVVSVMTMGMTSCTERYPAHTTPGTYTIAVQASGQTPGASAPTVHTLDVTLVVTP